MEQLKDRGLRRNKMEKENKEMKSNKEDKIEKELVREVKEEIKNKIPESPETNTKEKKEEAAEKIAEEVAEESEKAIDKIASKETSDKVKSKDDKKSKRKEPEVKIKKENAVTLGRNLHISKKHGMYICNFVKGKKIDNAMSDLELVLKFKKAVPFKGEIPHRKGKGMMSGRYPIKAVKIFVNLLKTLKGNSVVNGLDFDKTIIYSASSSWGARPLRRGSVRGKRTNIILEAREIGGKKKWGYWIVKK